MKPYSNYVTWIVAGLFLCVSCANPLTYDIGHYCLSNSDITCILRNITYAGGATPFTGEPNTWVRQVKFEDSNLAKIPKGLFYRLPNLVHFTAENCEIKSISREDLQEANFLQVLDLIFNRITDLPDGVFSQPSNLQDVRLGHNDIERLSNETFSNASNIVDLQLNANKIKTLPKDVFKPLVNLEYIDLEYNSIELIDSSTFQYNTKLRTILLNNNNMLFFAPDSFMHISELYLIDISFNNIKNISLNSLNTLRATKTNLTVCKLTGGAKRLKLSNNHLKSIDIGDISELRDLDIHKNQFERLDAFKDGRSLQNIDLSYNSIAISESLIFRQAKLLSELRLSGLKLNLTYEFFSDLTRLTLLDISENNLTSLDIRTLRPLQRLEHLYMERNDIPEFDYSQLKTYLPSLKEISIAGNPMSESFIAKLSEYCKANGIVISVVHKSLSGEDCTGKNQNNVDKDGLPTSLIVLMTIAVVLCLEAVAIICFKMWKRSHDGGLTFENPFSLRFQRLSGDSQSVQR